MRFALIAVSMLFTFLAGSLATDPAQAQDTELMVVERVSPEYPRRAAMAGITGYVELGFTVTSDGRASEIRVLNAKPSRVFDRAATQALSQWRFDANAADKTGSVRIDFQI